MNVVSLSCSPSVNSRAARLLHFVERRLADRAGSLHHVSLRELPAADLLAARADAPALRQAVAQVLEADLVLVATPIYKAAYSGLLKVFLDLLPPEALRGKWVLPMATGGSPAHQLALEYALKPVLATLGARHILNSVYITDEQWRTNSVHGPVPDADVIERIDAALISLYAAPRSFRQPAAALAAA